MKTRSILLAITIIITLQAPTEQALGQAKASNWRRHSALYKRSRNYASLRVLVKRLKVGMSQQTVERLLGEPDYSPIEGQFYYSSDRKNAGGVTIGLVVEYRKTEYRKDGIHTTLTGKLESYTLMAIGE